MRVRHTYELEIPPSFVAEMLEQRGISDPVEVFKEYRRYCLEYGRLDIEEEEIERVVRFGHKSFYWGNYGRGRHSLQCFDNPDDVIWQLYAYSEPVGYRAESVVTGATHELPGLNEEAAKAWVEDQLK